MGAVRAIIQEIVILRESTANDVGLAKVPIYKLVVDATMRKGYYFRKSPRTNQSKLEGAVGFGRFSMEGTAATLVMNVDSTKIRALFGI
jgi:hypothetical protein